MAFNVETNVDQVIKALAKMDNQATGKFIQQGRNVLRAEARRQMPTYRAITPADTGALKRALKVKSRSKKGVTKVSLVWLDNRYGSYVNNAKESPHLHLFTNKFRSLKQQSDARVTAGLEGVFVKFMNDNNIKVKR